MNKRKKYRGLRRYYKNLDTQDNFEKTGIFNLNSIGQWYENSHVHFDYYGFGNDSFKNRKPHLNKLFRHFDVLVDKTKDLKTDFQLYALLLNYHSSSDALFFHMRSTTNGQFSFKMSDLQTTSTLTNTLLNAYVNCLTHYEVLYGQANEPFGLIFKKGIGQPFLN